MPKRYREIVGDGGSNTLAQVEEFQARGMATVTPELMDEYLAGIRF